MVGRAAGRVAAGRPGGASVSGRLPIQGQAASATDRYLAALAVVGSLIQARDAAVTAGAQQTLKRIRLALTSAQGALRHASNRHDAEQRTAAAHDLAVLQAYKESRQ